MEAFRCSVRAILITVALVGVCSLAQAGDVDLGLLIVGPSGDYMFTFSHDEQYMLLRFGGDGAAFDILTDTTLYQDLCSVFATGIFEGYQTTGVGLLDREVVFGSPGGLESLLVVDRTLASFRFSTEVGAIAERFEIASDDLEDPHAYLQFVIGQVPGDLWVEVVNGQLVVAPEPVLRLLSFNQPAGGGGEVGNAGETVISVMIKNVSDVPFFGPVDYSIGLTYYVNWVPEWCTTYFGARIPDVALFPGETETFDLTIPVVPAWAVEELRKRATIWTGYVDPDPEQDYIGVRLSANGADWCVFLPFQDRTFTTVVRKANGSKGVGEP